jgi:hypothetical protein
LYPSNCIRIDDSDEPSNILRFRFHLPISHLNKTEGLLLIGSPPHRGLLSIAYEEDSTIRIGYTDGNGTNLTSPPLKAEQFKEHEIAIARSSVYAPLKGSRKENLPHLLLSYDRQPVLSIPYLGDSALAHTVPVSMATERFLPDSIPFSGRYAPIELRRDAAAILPSSFAKPSASDYGAFKIEAHLPKGRLGTSEPLVTTGVSGAGDFVYVLYEDSGHIKIGFDHWGIRGLLSRSIPIDYSVSHYITISIGSLYPMDGDILFQGTDDRQVDTLKHRILITIDGQTIIDAFSDCYESPPAFVDLGRNKIGGSTTGAVFSGTILSTMRVPLPSFR